VVPLTSKPPTKLLTMHH